MYGADGELNGWFKEIQERPMSLYKADAVRKKWKSH